MHRTSANKTTEIVPADAPKQALPDGALRQFMTPLVSLEHQVGAHVIHSLQQDNTVAVLTTVAPGPGGQSIVSVGLDAARLEEVQQLLIESQERQEPRVPCIGFHCFLPRKDEQDGK